MFEGIALSGGFHWLLSTNFLLSADLDLPLKKCVILSFLPRSLAESIRSLLEIFLGVGINFRPLSRSWISSGFKVLELRFMVLVGLSEGRSWFNPLGSRQKKPWHFLPEIPKSGQVHWPWPRSNECRLS